MPRQAVQEDRAHRVPFLLRPGTVAAGAMQAGDHGCAHVLGDHHVVAQVERRRVDPAVQQLARFPEVGTVVRRRPAVGEVDRHAVAATGAAGALPVVGRQRRHVAHQHGVELADVDPQLQGRRTDQAIHGVRPPLEQVLQPLALVGRDHGGMLFRAQHQVRAVEQLQVVVVIVLPQHAAAAPGRAAPMRQVARGGAAAAPAAPHAPVRGQTQPIGVDLIDAVHVGQWAPAGPLEPHRHQQPSFDQQREQALQHRLDRGRGNAPGPGDLPDRGIAAVAQPLHDQLRLFRSLPAQLGGGGTQESGQVSLLNLPVALHPVLREDLVLRVVQRAPAPQVVEDAGHAFSSRALCSGMSVVLVPRREVESDVLHHSSPSAAEDSATSRNTARKRSC